MRFRYRTVYIGSSTDLGPSPRMSEDFEQGEDDGQYGKNRQELNFSRTLKK